MTDMNGQDHADGSADTPCSTHLVDHEVIENKLLVAMDDASKVAIVADIDDVQLLIDDLTESHRVEGDRDLRARRRKRMIAGLKSLRDSAWS